MKKNFLFLASPNIGIFESWGPIIKYKLNDRGRRLGLTQNDLADVVRSGYLGNEVANVTWGDKRLPVRVIYPESIRQQSTSLMELPIVLDSGSKVFLGDVANINIGQGLNQVRRRDTQRMAKITADVDSSITTPSEVIKQIDQVLSHYEDLDNYIIGEIPLKSFWTIASDLD